MIEGRFAGKVALVTGGSSGIGRAAVLAFAREGARVVLASRRLEPGEAVRREAEALGASALFIPTDVSRADQVRALMHGTIDCFGRLDIAFNNAASIDVGAFKATADLSEEEFDQHMALNLKSVWLCMKQEIAQMLAQGGGGSIVNTSSINGLGGTQLNSLYAAAKAGILGLTKSAAQEYAAHGIRVNALVAGAFRTPMMEGVFHRISQHDPGSAEDEYASMIPLGRIGRPEEAAEAVLWLCSESASYVTGNSLIVDGGLTSIAR
jgi:NAD(P)-dependent dehydrogenase (short-subunit alcohol dehydrogenase family)